MKSEWRVTSNLIDGKKFYGVYRLLNIEEVDHSGNREHHGEFTQDRDKAVELAERLNKGGEGEESAGSGHLGICAACFEPIMDEAFQFRENGRMFHSECAKKAGNYYVKLEKKLALKERIAKLDQRETDEKENDLIKVVVIKPSELAKITEIGADLVSMQAVVGGYIQVIPACAIQGGKNLNHSLKLIFNPEGKRNQLPHNFDIWDGSNYIVGTCFVCKTKDEELVGLSQEEAELVTGLFAGAEKERTEKKKVCPCCGEEMEEFAIAWGWQSCFDCSVKAAERRKGQNEMD